MIAALDWVREFEMGPPLFGLFASLALGFLARPLLWAVEGQSKNRAGARGLPSPSSQMSDDEWLAVAKRGPAGPLIGSAEQIIFFSSLWTSAWVVFGAWITFKLAVMWASNKQTWDELNAFAPVRKYEDFVGRVCWLQQRALTHLLGTGWNIVAAFAGVALGRWIQ